MGLMDARRAQGSGTLTERPKGSGKWQWRVRIGDDPVTGKPRRIVRTFTAKNRSAADAKVRTFLREIEAEPVAGSEAPMSVLFDEWMRHTSARPRSPHTIDKERRTIDRVLNPAIGHIPIGQLRVKDLDTLYSGLLTGDHPVSMSTVRRYNAIVRAALQQAVTWDWISSNPATKVSLSEQASPPLVMPTFDEIQTLINGLRDEGPNGRVYAMAADLAWSTGIRRGELCALRWSDWANGSLRIHASVYRVSGETGIKSTKSGRERLVPVSGPTANLLLGWHMECVKRALDDDLAPSAFILSAWPDGSRPLNPDSLSAAFRRVALANDLGHVHLHSLRHFAATEMVAGGVGVNDAADVLGHANTRMTLEVYGHARTDRKREAMEVLGRLAERQKAPQPEG